MAKIATDQDIASIINSIVDAAPGIEDARYRMFLDTIAEAVGAYHAVEIGAVTAPSEHLPAWTASFHASIDTQSDGGPFAMIDTDVTIDEWLSDVRPDPDRSHGPVSGHATGGRSYSETGSGAAGVV